ncbi:MAG: outer membrane protein assembly factor BamB family protein, partial [Planctomycetota bacterium]
PTYSDGRLFVCCGYASHEFYCLDARPGAVIWPITTSDDGPTAAVVQDGYVVFNTESCTIICVRAFDGGLVWEEWLGDPLMSHPAVQNGKVYMAYPAGQRGGNIPEMAIPEIEIPPMPGDEPVEDTPDGPAPTETPAEIEPAEPVLQGSHRLLCADLATGDHIWEQPITSDVITAPVIAEGKVFVTCFDGTSFCFDAETGELVWRKEGTATSAPLILRGQVFQTQRVDQDGQTVEGIGQLDSEGNDATDELAAAGEADYLAADQGGGVGIAGETLHDLDSSVGFAEAPAAAGLAMANTNVGVYTVAGGWAYQGSRVVAVGGMIGNAQGNNLNWADAETGHLKWRGTIGGEGVAAGQQVFAPPSMGKERMYLAGATGHLIAVEMDDGETAFAYQTGHAIAFQPALAEGRVFVGTIDGLVICLETGDDDADGWPMWGGNAQHNLTR